MWEEDPLTCTGLADQMNNHQVIKGNHLLDIVQTPTGHVIHEGKENPLTMIDGTNTDVRVQLSTQSCYMWKEDPLTCTDLEDQMSQNQQVMKESNPLTNVGNPGDHGNG